MKVRIARLGVLVAGVLGLLGTYMPSAEADTLGTVEFVINATVGTGNTSIAYPCFTGLPNQHLPPPVPPVPLIDLALCLLLSTLMTGTTTHAVTVKPKPLPKHPGDVMVNFQFDRPASGVTFASVACAGVVVNNAKLTKPATESGLCTIGGAGIVSGHCGLSTGEVSGTLANDTNTYGFTVKFTGIGGLLLINGHVTLNTGNGWIKGKAAAIPNPVAGSCTNKHPLVFIVAGSATVLINIP